MAALDGVRLSFVVEKVVIDRVIGTESIMSEQLGNLLGLMRKGRIRLQVVPDGVHRHPGLCSPFRIIDTARDGSVLCMEHSYGSAMFKDTEKITEMRDLFGALQGEALPSALSEALIEEAMEKIK